MALLVLLTPVLTSLASDECIGGRGGFGYRLLKSEALNAGIGEIGMCVSCNSHLELVESIGQRKGLISSIDIVCSNSTCKRSVNVCIIL